MPFFVNMMRILEVCDHGIRGCDHNPARFSGEGIRTGVEGAFRCTCSRASDAGTDRWVTPVPPPFSEPPTDA